jgi:hypothetical protein
MRAAGANLLSLLKRNKCDINPEHKTENYQKGKVRQKCCRAIGANCNTQRKQGKFKYPNLPPRERIISENVHGVSI